MPLDPGRCVVSRRPRRWARRERLLVDSSRRDVNENSIICVYARYATANRGRSEAGYNSEIKKQRETSGSTEGKGELAACPGAPRLNILNGLFAAGEAAQRRSMSAPAAPQKEHRTADRAQEKRCVPPADAACAHCTRDRTGRAQARQERSGRSELAAQVAAHRSDASQQRPCLQSPSPASWGSARPPLASGVATPQESDLASRAYATREVIME